MKALGITALICTFLSLCLWTVNWVVVTFFIASMAYGSPLRYVYQSTGFLSSMTEFLALALISIGLIVGANRGVK